MTFYDLSNPQTLETRRSSLTISFIELADSTPLGTMRRVHQEIARLLNSWPHGGTDLGRNFHSGPRLADVFVDIAVAAIVSNPPTIKDCRLDGNEYHVDTD